MNMTKGRENKKVNGGTIVNCPVEFVPAGYATRYTDGTRTNKKGREVPNRQVFCSKTLISEHKRLHQMYSGAKTFAESVPGSFASFFYDVEID